MTFLGPAIVVASGAFMLWWSWGTWPDPVVDFGRELYVPWRLSEGDVLYRDIVSYFNGPLSPHVHAMLFRVFGVSLRTLVTFNLLLVAGLATLLYRLIAQAAGHLAAAACGVTFFTLFAFAQFTVYGNFNFVCPYSYDLTHGITLSAGGIACVARWHRSGTRIWLALSGLILGLVFLTKAEVFLAAAAALAGGVAGAIWLKPMPPRRAAWEAATFLCFAILPVIAAFLLLLGPLSAKQALLGLAGAWRWAGNRQLLELPYFRDLIGTLDPSSSAQRILYSTAAYVAVFGLPALVGALTRRDGKDSLIISALVFVVLLVAGAIYWRAVNWSHMIRPLPLLLAGVAVIFILNIVRRRSTDVLPLMLVLWALALLPKILFNVHHRHYGFALAMPTTLVGIALFLGWLPAWLDRVGRSGAVLRAAVLASLIVMVIAHAFWLNQFWSMKRWIVGAGADAFRADARGDLVNQTIAELSRLAKPGSTLAVLPEGVIVNYLTRRTNPTGQLNFTPPAMIMYGEAEMLRTFRQHPPDFILIVDKETSEYGAKFFGVDYGRELADWIEANYLRAKVIGDPLFTGNGMGILLMQHN